MGDGGGVQETAREKGKWVCCPVVGRMNKFHKMGGGGEGGRELNHMEWQCDL